jgi:hypothetical protein
MLYDDAQLAWVHPLRAQLVEASQEPFETGIVGLGDSQSCIASYP